MTERAARGARLVYVVGASGSGKDSLIQYARSRLEERDGIGFAHRYITRPAGASGENHIALSAGEFETRRRHRLFALCWHSHGLHYGVGIEIDHWLRAGLTVVVNGSRDHLVAARERYPDLQPVHVQVSREVLRARLLARGRDSSDDIERRLARNSRFGDGDPPGPVIRNDGLLAVAGDEFVDLLGSLEGVAQCV